ncbi:MULTISPECIES: hypothetical protein [Limnospira]|uniref:hypothetical protein n=1 Tax=Limnospira TaxID=2596745 RepID=UPI0011D291ED|nr:hypothetical protein [Arthrospira platensis]MDF2208936.1 hypothetical protein [Arthrospira platensis NCB002]MDT9182923.1 hypothetical protein [Limnospira sp. PMC 289.06]MDT9295104.1 hypothetical protein [Arthrospira platensis PCC 7345]
MSTPSPHAPIRIAIALRDRTIYFPLPLLAYIIKIKICQSRITEHFIPVNRISGETCCAIAHSVAQASCLYNRGCDRTSETLGNTSHSEATGTRFRECRRYFWRARCAIALLKG